MRAVGVAAAALACVLAAPREARAVDREACFSAAESAQQLRSQSKLREARDRLLVCSQQGCPAAVLADCTKWLAEVKEAIPSIAVHAHDMRGNDLADVVVSIDGQQVAGRLDGRPIEIDPGEHTVRFAREGSPPVEKSIVGVEGQKSRAVDVEIATSAAASGGASGTAPQPQEHTQRRIPVAAWILGGVGAAALVSTAIFWAVGRSQYSDLQGTCAPSCDPSRVDSVRTKLIVGDVSLAVAFVSVGVAGWFYFRF